MLTDVKGSSRDNAQLSGTGLYLLWFVVLVFILVLPNTVSASTEVITLQGEQDSDAIVPDTGHYRLETSDGGRVSIAYSLSFGGKRDIHVVKTDKSDVIEWEKSFGGSNDDEARHIIQTSDGGYILTGYTSSQGAGGRDMYVLKLNKWGDKTWEGTYGGINDDEGSYLQQTVSGSYVVVGYTKSLGNGNADGFAVGLDRNGKKLWQRTYGGKDSDYIGSVQTINNGGFILVGATRSFGDGNWKLYAIKCGSSGTVAWEKAIGGKENYIGAFAQQAPNNEFLLIGYAYSSAQQRDLCLVKLNSSGHLLWENRINEQNLYGESLALALSPETIEEDTASAAENALPPPEVPQQKYSRKKTVEQPK